MFDNQFVGKRNARDEAEKPFWISFADLMTATMILFLVIMCAALLSVTRKISDTERKTLERGQEIQALLERLKEDIKGCGQGATVWPDRLVIDFGPQAHFDFGSHKLSSSQERYLRECAPYILSVADSELGRKWIKRIVVEGYTDQKGGYLINLNLSLQRSQRVLCALLGKPALDERSLSPDQRKQIRQLFLVGGYSFNSTKASPEESRRVEMRLEFWGVADQRDAVPEDQMASVELDAYCPLDGPPPVSLLPRSNPTVPTPALPRPSTGTPATNQQSPSILRRLFGN